MVNDVVHGARSFNVNDWATRQAYIALGNFMTCATLLGVDTCPMEGIEPVNYDRTLGLSAKGLTTVAIEGLFASRRKDDLVFLYFQVTGSWMIYLQPQTFSMNGH